MSLDNNFKINKSDDHIESRNEVENVEDKKRDPFDPYYKWLADARKQIEEQKIANAGKTKGAAIAGMEVSAYDAKAAHLSLDDYGELKFIEFASEKGNEEQSECALDMVNKLYADRDDLRAGIYANMGDIAKAEELIINSKDRSLHSLMAILAKKIDTNHPGFINGLLEKMNKSQREQFKFDIGQ